ncbi:unnamed protein product [Gongylonema pulchrum]|uniref:Transposase n=1 Tax=Gongylonema pulchrum TaxID=637853 RepID=A0A183E683_9BILA|nr:unnamed protein product [Gongylonema pulchrum]
MPATHNKKIHSRTNVKPTDQHVAVAIECVARRYVGCGNAMAGEQQHLDLLNGLWRISVFAGCEDLRYADWAPSIVQWLGIHRVTIESGLGPLSELRPFTNPSDRRYGATVESAGQWAHL